MGGLVFGLEGPQYDKLIMRMCGMCWISARDPY